MNDTSGSIEDLIGLVLIVGTGLVLGLALVNGLNAGKPKGELRPLYDAHGNPVLNSSGEHLYADETGKLFTESQALRHQRESDQPGCLSMLLFLWIFDLFR